MEQATNPTARYTMRVLAQNVPDAVQFSGALIFDRAAGGWDVTVCTPEDTCTLALDILGATRVDLASLFGERVSFPSVLVVTSRLYTANRLVEAHVAAALASGATEVFFAGLDAPNDAVRGDAYLYAFGSAASAFKKIAARAAGAQIDPVERTEHFYPSTQAVLEVENF